MTNVTNTQAKEMIKAEAKRRMDLVECPKFRADVLEAAKLLGITAEEWNKEKAMICLYYANEYCAFENKKNKTN
jgi:phage I-like protein